MAVDEQMNGSAPANADALRAEIAATRAQLGETVEALAMKTDVKARTKDAIDQTVTDAKDRGQQVVSRGQRALAHGWDAVTRQQQALVDKMGETAKKPALIWTGVGIGAALGAGVAAVVWLRARNRTVPQVRTVYAWKPALVRTRH